MACGGPPCRIPPEPPAQRSPPPTPVRRLVAAPCRPMRPSDIPPPPRASSGAVPKSSRTTFSKTTVDRAGRSVTKMSTKTREIPPPKSYSALPTPRTGPGAARPQMSNYETTVRAPPEKPCPKKSGIARPSTVGSRTIMQKTSQKGPNYSKTTTTCQKSSNVKLPPIPRVPSQTSSQGTSRFGFKPSTERKPLGTKGPPTLESEMEKRLLASSAKAFGKSLKATGVKTGLTQPPVMMTPCGPIPAAKKVTRIKSVIRAPGQPEIIAKGITGIETIGPDEATISEVEIQTCSPKVKIPESITGREVVEVLSSVAIGGGYIETTRTVSYEQPESHQEKKVPLTPQEVARLVAEENADINNAQGLLMPELQASRPVTYMVKKHVEVELLHHSSVSILEQSVIPQIPTPDTEHEEPQPEMIATIMSTEERGLAMGSPPSNMYNYLFSNLKPDALMDVSSAAPAPLQDIVIPISMPDQTQENAMNPDVIQIGMNILAKNDEPIPESLYVETIGKELPPSKNTAKKGTFSKSRKGPMLSKQVPPWGIQDVEPLLDLVGAPPATTYSVVPELEADEPICIDPTVDGIEYMLQMEPPKHSSRVQLRGSQNPSWFPGYYLALPQIPDVLTLVRSPSIVFSSAWKATQPNIFADESIFIA